MEVARHVYGGRPSEEELAAFGVQAEDVAGDVEVWPENAEAVVVFLKLRTQWRMASMGGLTGLVYAEVWNFLRALRIPRARWSDIFDGVQVMERAVLELAAEKRNHG